jgi:hypothetical protein
MLQKFIPYSVQSSRAVLFILLLASGCAGSPEKKTSSASPDDSIHRQGFVIIMTEGTTVKTRFAVLPDFERIGFPDGSFQSYLRNLPLKPHGSYVNLYDGRVKFRQVHEAVIDHDPGNKNLQQCADAVIRLRAEYQYDNKQYNAIHFNLTNGFRVDYSKWIQGYRVAVDGNRTWWVKSKEPGNTPLIFKQYLEFVYTYAGTLSLIKELEKISLADLQPGDVFIQGGSPGHAVIVVDAAVSMATGEKLFMLAQSYMPAQDIHILKNPNEPDISPWYRVDSLAGRLITPEWTFEPCDLMRFRED